MEKPKTKKYPIRIYLLITSIIVSIIVLFIFFEILPNLIKTINKVSQLSMERIKEKTLFLIIVFFVFIILFNFYFWRKDKKIKEKEKEVKEILKFSPNTPFAQQKIQQIKKWQKYQEILVVIFFIILGMMVSFIALTVFSPIFRLINEPF